MNIFKRGMVFVTFFGCCFGIALMAAALGTTFWFEADAKRVNVTSNDYIPEAQGHIHFGLFKGVKTLDWGIGERVSVFTVSKDDPPVLMDQGLWIATIVFLSIALLFAVVGALFAVINTATTPIELITGVMGLYVWNGCAAACCLVAVICWAVEFNKYMTDNVLVTSANDNWTTDGYEQLGYSFWLVVVAMIVHVANCIIVVVGTYEPKAKDLYEAPESKPGNIMLY